MLVYVYEKYVARTADVRDTEVLKLPCVKETINDPTGEEGCSAFLGLLGTVTEFFVDLQMYCISEVAAVCTHAV